MLLADSGESRIVAGRSYEKPYPHTLFCRKVETVREKLHFTVRLSKGTVWGIPYCPDVFNRASSELMFRTADLIS